ncbi:MAG: polysaccharide biosynthesis protein [Bacilli bacterium]|nr:polysaccharide biosynthesis protein [Bacilli bacterium]
MSLKTGRTLRYVGLFLMDAGMILLLFLFSCWASLDNGIFSPSYWSLPVVGALWAVTLSSVFAIFGFYRIAMSRIGLFESLKIVLVSAAVDVTFYLGLFLSQSIPALNVPWILNWRVFALMVAVHVFAVVALRFVPRIYRALSARFSGKKNLSRALLLGAGDAAKILIEDAKVNPSVKRLFVGALDDDPRKWGSTIGGVRVYGSISEARDYIESLKVEEVIIAIPSLSPERYAEILEDLSSCDVRLRKVPALGELDKVNEARVVDISYKDLLGRPLFEVNESKTEAKFKGSGVLLTGGGGSLGTAIALELIRLGAKDITLLDHYENGLTDAATQANDRIRNEGYSCAIHTVLASITREEDLDAAFAKYHPDYVFHCAAVKHVPLAEDHPSEAVRVNVFGTDAVCRMAVKHQCKEVFFLSTEKAAHPDSVMAKTKRLGEICCLHYGKSQSVTTFYCLRFGNVLASKGSVVPLFSKQIARGGPVTVTSEQASRFFFTLEDCVGLILDAASMEQSNCVYDLEAGKATSILSLAESLIRQAGYIPHKDIEIVVTGLRHGEAVPMEVPYDRSVQTATENEHIYVESGGSALSFPKVLSALKGLSGKETKKALSEISLE